MVFVSLIFLSVPSRSAAQAGPPSVSVNTASSSITPRIMTAPFAWQALWHHGGPPVRHETKVIYQHDEEGILMKRLSDVETMSELPLFPSLYQINTRVWLTELSRALGRRATLDDLPDAELDRAAGMG